MSRIHRHRSHQDDDAMSNASLGTAAAFKSDVGVGTLFLKDGDYNVEFLQTFISKPLNASKKAATKPLRQPVLFSETPQGFKPRTVIYFKTPSLERDPQQRAKFNLLDKEEQQRVEVQAKVSCLHFSLSFLPQIFLSLSLCFLLASTESFAR